MTEHPITPPPELVERLRSEAPYGVRALIRERHLTAAAYRAGADAELEAVCEWLREAKHHGLGDEVGAMLAGRLRAAMRPKPPSLAEQALGALRSMRIDPVILNGINVNKHVMDQYSIIQRALERLQQLEQESNDN